MENQLRDEFQRLRQENPQKLAEIIQSMSDAEAEAILYDYTLWAHDKQMAVLESDYPVTLYCGGRGTGKSQCASWAVKKYIDQGVKQIGLIGATTADTRDTMVLGVSGILNAFPEADRPEYEPSKRRVYWPNKNAQAILYSAEEPERLRGGNNEVLIMDEIGSWKDKDTYDQAMLTLRVGVSRALITSTPRNNEIFRYLHAHRHDPENNPEGFVKWVTGSTYENLHNLSRAFRDQIMSNYEGTRLGQQELMGELLLDSDEALWNSDMIADAREYSHNIPPAKSCVIGVDPAVSTKKKSDKTGIVLAIMGVDDVAYVLEDHTGKYSPEGWARVVIELFKEWQQKCPTTIVVERNQGGEMVRNTLERVERWLPIDDIFSSQDKLSRAQPIALMYEKGKVKHAPGLVDLEQELCSYDGKGRSPDRMDAMVFALTKLMPVNRSITRSRELLM